MIHTSSANSSSNSIANRISGRMRLAFCVIALLLNCGNFIPLCINSREADVDENNTSGIAHQLTVCYILAIPLLLELFVDVVVVKISKSHVEEYKFRYFIMLLSLFLPVVLVKNCVHPSLKYSVLFTSCFISFLQSIVIIAQYDWLMVVTNGFWSVGGCLSCVMLLVGSQIAQNFSIAYDPEFHHKFTFEISHYFSLALGIIWFLLHLKLSKNYLYLFRVIDAANTTNMNDVVGFVLQNLITIYIVGKIVTTLSSGSDVDIPVLSEDLMILIVLVLCAAILPGQIIRKKLILTNEKMESKDSFIRYVSHEIRSPLSTTSLGLHYLLDKISAKKVTEVEVLDVLRESTVTCELALSTLNDFLMLDKMQSNMLEITKSICNANDYLIEVVRPFSLQATSSDITLVCNTESFDGINCRNLTANIDSYKMNQVLRNLLSNAFKFTPCGGRITVTMSTFECSANETNLLNVNLTDKYWDGSCSMLKIEVTDSGCGISAKNLPKLFGQYVQFDADKLQGGKGSGLGLWLSKAIVEMHGGKIGATSEGEGKGCTFWFTIPCLEDFAAETASMSFVTHSFSMGTRNPSPSTAFLCPDTARECEEGLELEDDIEQGQLMNLTSPKLGRKLIDLQIDVSTSAKAMNRIKASPAHKKSANDSTITPLNVLLVDDSIIARRMVERSLKSIEAICFHASNGVEAINKVVASTHESWSFDVILIDHYMPEMNGPEAVEAIRHAGFKGIIIALCGNANDSGFDELMKNGLLNKVMTKPFNLDRFLDCMEEHMPPCD